jgi:hypothetical protein
MELTCDSDSIAPGSLLLDFALEFASKMNMSLICAVTRCTNFVGTTAAEFEDYVKSREARGPLSDRGLSFHLIRGATIIRCIPNWRPGDRQNLGYGVLVQYVIKEQRRLVSIRPAFSLKCFLFPH